MDDIINSKGKKWQGYYEQWGTKYPMSFDKFYVENEIIKGAGSDTVGTFEIDGKCTDGNVRFDKQYIGQHNVVYIGTYDGRVISGKWNIGTMNDNFKIWRADISQWKGVFYENGKAFTMSLDLGVEEGIIGGTGEDYIGNFSLAGAVDDNGKVSLTKEYLGEKTINMEGEFKDEVIKGTYKDNDSICMFTIEKCQPEQYEKDFAGLQGGGGDDEEEPDYGDEQEAEDDD